MNTQEFLLKHKEILDSISKITEAKNHDYAWELDPFKNFKLCEHLGICSVEEWILVRMTDKVSRISNLLHKENKVQGESTIDSLIDLSNYCIILSIYLWTK